MLLSSCILEELSGIVSFLCLQAEEHSGTECVCSFQGTIYRNVPSSCLPDKELFRTVVPSCVSKLRNTQELNVCYFQGTIYRNVPSSCLPDKELFRAVLPSCVSKLRNTQGLSACVPSRVLCLFPLGQKTLKGLRPPG